jgi:hypothetical protein
MINDRVLNSKAQRLGLYTNGYIIDTKKGVYLETSALD